jgi:hypothetical protein
MPEWAQLAAAIMVLVFNAGIVGLLLRNGAATARLAERVEDLRMAISEIRQGMAARVSAEMCEARRTAIEQRIDDLERRVRDLERGGAGKSMTDLHEGPVRPGR